MIKRIELTDPSSCLNRAHVDEMVFVLLARDAAAPYAIRAWVAERVRLGKNTYGDAQIIEALACADRMEVHREPGVRALVDKTVEVQGRGHGEETH